MRRLAIVVALAAACGGSEESTSPQKFTAEHAVAEIRDGAPYCEAGKTGTGLIDTGARPETHVVASAACHWTCAEILGFDNEAVSVYFAKVDGTGSVLDGKWSMAVYRDGDCH